MSSNVLRRLLKTDMLEREVNRVEEPKEGVEGAGKCTVELMQLRPISSTVRVLFNIA